MVSFQCNSCGDIVKKPKLDQHSAKCHSGFDCIDCSKTFGTPAQWKGHTSCISEAEKYQKALYKGPRVAASAFVEAPIVAKPRESQPHAAAANGGYGNRNSGGGYGGGYGGRGGRGGGGGGGRAPSIRVTGANETPLGATSRVSPFITRPASSEPKSKPVVSKMNSVEDAVPASAALEESHAKKGNKKRKSPEEDTGDGQVETVQKGAKAAPESEAKEKKRLEKKAKKNNEVEEKSKKDGTQVEGSRKTKKNKSEASESKEKKSKKSKST